jgi:hypothetical protein
MGITMRRKEEEEDLVGLMESACVPDDEIETYLFTGKISRSIANKIFKGNVPDKYKDIIVSDKYFKKLVKETKKKSDSIMAEENDKEISSIYIVYEKIGYN